MRPRRRLRNDLLLLGASLTLSLAAAELLLGVLAPRIKPYSVAFTGPRMPFTASAYLPATSPISTAFRHRKAEFDVTYRFNEFGYRGTQPRTIEKPARTTRLLFLGDSFTLGWGNAQEDTFVQRLAERLTPHGYEAINAGYRGFISPDAYYAYLRREGMALAPDMVIVALYSGNDVADVRDNQWHELDDLGLPRRLTTIRLFTDLNGAFLFPPGTRETIVRWYYGVPLVRESRVWVGLMGLAARLAGEPRAGRLELFGAVGEPEPIEEGWRKFELAIAGLNRRCREGAVEIAFALIPPHPNHPYFNDDSGAHNRMLRLVRASGARVLDLRPYLTGDHYFAKDGHLNAAGNAVVEERLAAFLRAEGLLPSLRTWRKAR